MMIFLILLPFGVFSAMMMLTSADTALFAAAATGLGVIAHDLARGRQLKMLGAGSVAVFLALGLYIALVDSTLSTSAVKLTVDAGVLAISLASIAIRRPFTLQYAREMVDAETHALPGFLTVNYIMAWAWTACFVLMMIGNILVIYIPSLPLWAGIAIAFAARTTAVYFTKWYPDYRRAKFGTPPASANALSGS